MLQYKLKHLRNTEHLFILIENAQICFLKQWFLTVDLDVRYDSTKKWL